MVDPLGRLGLRPDLLQHLAVVRRLAEQLRIERQHEQRRDADECRKIAYAIGHSPLVKTAFFASDPNLGRILAAVGYAGVPDLDVSKIDVFLGEVCIASQGCRASSYSEEQGAAVMAREEITIRIELGRSEEHTSELQSQR